ncbi:putative glucose-6-phosphate 1-epimerase isoform X1 [Amborella trichopoda]|nr:putative glucose-6-phosphate 1-epimerase isoform X1 [Amborella trichopoda]|eukprot:XP_011623716.1 putative glucose-6-phosphate 1-epimerase isoform X1 [Amborella trichopoda]
MASSASVLGHGNMAFSASSFFLRQNSTIEVAKYQKTCYGYRKNRFFINFIIRKQAFRTSELCLGFVGTTVAIVNQERNCLGIQFTEGEGKLPKVLLKSNSGSEAEVYLFGGCVTSWKVANDKDLLFVRPDAVFNGKKPISGGIPHCFPQFGPGSMQQHGFARNMTWSVAKSENVEGNPVLTLELKDDPYSRSMWNFAFLASYKVALNSKSLSTELVITNTDSKPFSFNSALHTYFRGFISAVSVKGLKGCKTLNKDPDPSNPIEKTEEREVITFPGFVDCIYLDAPEELHLNNGLGDIISIRNQNWTDAVLWNPYTQMESCYRDFVCVENAKIGQVTLESGQSWTAKQDINLNE